MSAEIALIHLAVVALPALAALYCDLSSMRIPNWVSLLTAGLFLAVGLATLPLDVLGWRVVVAVAVFVVGLMLYALGQMGAGDVKFATAIFLFVAWSDIGLFLRILGIMALAGLLTHRIFAHWSFAREMAPNWASWNATGKFPYGAALSTAILYYLLLIGVTG
ncbi:prepilin peptidase [Roseobacter sp. HKCCA0434]|uniref:A24 family peptidase n=1 Tax=Roseobacter sp. HKCCA0434 TaxID=3079297 RepID=UPI002905814E|nr:prepilin peptidase [Roseobacter sp. HKCCA0434]